MSREVKAGKGLAGKEMMTKKLLTQCTGSIYNKAVMIATIQNASPGAGLIGFMPCGHHTCSGAFYLGEGPVRRW